MSLNINGERLLAEALADAMDRDLADVPGKEQLEKQHRFSKKFVRRIKRIEEGIENGYGTEPEHKNKAGNKTRAEHKIEDHKKRPRDFAELGKRARRYGGMAAALVCIIGLTAFLGLMGRMGASKMGDSAFPEDTAQWEEAEEEEEQEQNDASLESGVAAEEKGDAPVDDAADLPAEDDEEAPASAESTTQTGDSGFTGEAMAPGWQEQLLAESEKADGLISWHLAEVYDGTSFVLESESADNGEMGASPALTVSVSLICEVYYQENPDEWLRVYRTNRSMVRCEPGTVWGDEYFMQELNMRKPGTYRVVRQVNGYRQVLELTLERVIS